MTKRRLALGLLGFIAIYSIVWLAVAGVIEKRLLASLSGSEMSGVHLAYRDHHRGGYPFNVVVTLDDVTVTVGLDLSLTAPRLDLKPGRHGASAVFSHAEVNGLTFAGPVGMKTLFASIGETEDGPRLILNASAVHLPGPPVPALGSDIRRLTLDATLEGSLPSLTTSALAAWRDAGGTLEVHELSADWGPLGLGMGGTMALDAHLQPTGAFTASIAGYKSVVDGLASAGLIKLGRILPIDAALGVLAHPAGPDNVATIDTPVTVQDQTVYLGPFRLCQLPALVIR